MTVMLYPAVNETVQTIAGEWSGIYLSCSNCIHPAAVGQCSDEYNIPQHNMINLVAGGARTCHIYQSMERRCFQPSNASMADIIYMIAF